MRMYVDYWPGVSRVAHLHPLSLQQLYPTLYDMEYVPRTVRLHDLRHTCATLLLGKGVHPKIVQELLEHATIAITLDTYSHVLPDMQGEVVSTMETLLS
jgi:integrase